MAGHCGPGGQVLVVSASPGLSTCGMLYFFYNTKKHPNLTHCSTSQHCLAHHCTVRHRPARHSEGRGAHAGLREPDYKGQPALRNLLHRERRPCGVFLRAFGVLHKKGDDCRGCLCLCYSVCLHDAQARGKWGIKKS